MRLVWKEKWAALPQKISMGKVTKHFVVDETNGHKYSLRFMDARCYHAHGVGQGKLERGEQNGNISARTKGSQPGLTLTDKSPIF